MHGVAKDDREATKLAILAGVDISMQSDLYNLYLPELVASGDLPMAVVDESGAARVTHEVSARAVR